METLYDQSTFETLPDEMLLEVCKYLLCSDILYSFMELNGRITRMIARYRHHLSFHKTSIGIFDHLCVHVLPQIGTQIRSLYIDCHHSVLQDRLFIRHFREKMPVVFPNLQRISLHSYDHDELVAFLHTLHALNDLVEIRLYNLFVSSGHQQASLPRLLFQANNHRLTTVLISDNSSFLCIDGTDRYLNILHLRLKLETIGDLPLLFATVPNVQHLIVTTEKRSFLKKLTDMTLASPLLHLVNFSLESISPPWTLEHLMTLLAVLPFIERLSLSLTIDDERLLRGDTILSLLPSSVQQFNYMIHFDPRETFTADTTIAPSWPPSHPIAYFRSDQLLVLHTLPWRFSCFKNPSFDGRMVTSQTANGNGYDEHIEEVYFSINKTASFGKSLAILSQCRRAKEVFIHIATARSDALQEDQLPFSCIAQLPRVEYIWFFGSIPSDLNYFSIILHALPNLFGLRLSFGYLLRFIEDPSICSILSQRITSLCIFPNEANSSSVDVNEQHLPMIASTFPRIREMYVNIMHLPSSATKTSSKDILEGSAIQNTLSESNGWAEEVISPLSSESMLLCLLSTFREHRLLSVCMDGQFVEKIKADPAEWLRANSVLGEQQFEAALHVDLVQLAIWM